MCIAIYKPADKEISEEVLRTCFTNNKDGCGFAYINTDNKGVKRIKVKKSMTFDSFYEKYLKAIELAPDSPFIIHFRIKTHGKIDLGNCHPFRVDRDTVFIHNGTISGVGHSPEKSDTRLFNEGILRKLPKVWKFNDAIKALIAEFIGFSKLVFLHKSGTVDIINEKKGYWQDGVWFSNKTYEPKKVYTYTKPASNKSTSQYNKTPKSTPKALPAPRKKGTVPKCIHRYNAKTNVKCDLCGNYHKIEDMTGWYEYGEPTLYCKLCVLSKSVGTVSLESKDHKLLSLRSIIDWFNSENRESSDLDLHTFTFWQNPWGDLYPEEYSEVPDDYEEMQEGAYQAMLERGGHYFDF